MRVACFALLTLCGCQAVFPIQEEKSDSEAADAPTTMDGTSPVDGGLPEATVEAGDGGSAGIFCGADASCTGTCCVTAQSGWVFQCKPKGDTCAGATYAFECDDPSRCGTSEPICCYHETGVPEAGYHVTSACTATCDDFDHMCGGPGAPCPTAQSCQFWFSGYYLCK